MIVGLWSTVRVHNLCQRPVEFGPVPGVYSCVHCSMVVLVDATRLVVSQMEV